MMNFARNFAKPYPQAKLREISIQAVISREFLIFRQDLIFLKYQYFEKIISHDISVIFYVRTSPGFSIFGPGRGPRRPAVRGFPSGRQGRRGPGAQGILRAALPVPRKLRRKPSKLDLTPRGRPDFHLTI